MKTTWSTLLLLLATVDVAAQDAKSLTAARKGFTTKLVKQLKDDAALDAPPRELFTIVKYQGGAGQLKAYLGAAPKPGKHPAIVWITGGFPPGGTGAQAWEPPDRGNEQTAQAYRHAGMVMMYPTVRGSFGNPGVAEGFLGEADDVLAAIAYLKKVESVDPTRIYLGGHSTGATLALLVAAMTDQVAGVFAFGPVDDPVNYGQKNLPYDAADAREARVRAPVHWLGDLKAPTFVIEGRDGNYDSFRALQAACKNPAVKFLSVKGADHFNYLGAAHALVAKKLVAGTPSVAEAEIEAAYSEEAAARREAADLRALADAREAGHSLSAVKTIRFLALAREKGPLLAALKASEGQGFEAGEIEERKDDKGKKFYALVFKKRLRLGDLPEVFAASAKIDALCAKSEAIFNRWDVE